MQVKVKKGNILLLLALMVFIACDRDNNNPGYAYIPDMDDSRAYESYTENPVYEDKKTMREPATGTVPRGDFPYPFQKTVEGMEKAGKFLKNPYSATEKLLNAARKYIISSACNVMVKKEMVKVISSQKDCTHINLQV